LSSDAPAGSVGRTGRMAKRVVVVGIMAPWLFTATLAATQEAAATGQAGASASASLDPEADPAASPAGPASPTPPPSRDTRTFWEIIGEDNPNPATYEISFVSIALNKSWGIANWRGGGFYFGAGGGIGTSLYRISKMEDRDVSVDPMLEAVFGNLFFRISPVEFVDVDLGGRLALGSSLFEVEDAPRSGFVRGGYADLRIGSKKVKLGPRFEYDSIVYAGFNEAGWKLTPLMLRVVND
jgi:hypothetical protein